MRIRHAISSARLIWVLPALLLLSACASQPAKQIVKTELVEVEVPVLVALPEVLTRDCNKPEFPEKATVGAIQDLVVFLYTALDVCSQEKSDIRDLQP